MTRTKKARERGLRYVGDGNAHLTGVPARDLTPADIGQLTPKQLAAALANTDLYHLMPAPTGEEDDDE